MNKIQNELQRLQSNLEKSHQKISRLAKSKGGIQDFQNESSTAASLASKIFSLYIIQLTEFHKKLSTIEKRISDIESRL